MLTMTTSELMERVRKGPWKQEIHFTTYEVCSNTREIRGLSHICNKFKDSDYCLTLNYNVPCVLTAHGRKVNEEGWEDKLYALWWAEALFGDGKYCDITIVDDDGNELDAMDFANFCNKNIPKCFKCDYEED